MGGYLFTIDSAKAAAHEFLDDAITDVEIYFYKLHYFAEHSA